MQTEKTPRAGADHSNNFYLAKHHPSLQPIKDALFYARMTAHGAADLRRIEEAEAATAEIHTALFAKDCD